MLIELLVLKLTFDGILKECNRIALEQDTKTRGAWLKSRLAKVDLDYYKGLIDLQTYNRLQADILGEIDSLSKQNGQDGADSNIGF